MFAAIVMIGSNRALETLRQKKTSTYYFKEKQNER
jgi:hypothetical protein